MLTNMILLYMLNEIYESLKLHVTLVKFTNIEKKNSHYKLYSLAYRD